MSNGFAVVDLFAGPGGLAEGFSAVRTPEGARAYRVALSVEMDTAAHSTLLLRTFLRQFDAGQPPQYIRFLNEATEEPDWEKLYPEQWKAAEAEALKLTLGAPDSDAIISARLAAIRKKHGGNTIVIGGPPCRRHIRSSVARAIRARQAMSPTTIRNIAFTSSMSASSSIRHQRQFYMRLRIG